MPSDRASATNPDRSSFERTPQGWARLWQAEMAAAQRALTDWHEQARKAVEVYQAQAREGKTLNLFAADVDTKKATLFGKTPKVDAKRKHDDSEDEPGRVGSLVLQRALNCEEESDGDSYPEVCEQALHDWLTAGLGVARVRYVADFEAVEAVPATDAAPEVPAHERKTSERVAIDYVHHSDLAWNAEARTPAELRWVGFRARVPREEAVERFGEEVARLIPFSGKPEAGDAEGTPEPWARATIWEIWSKEHGRVFWYAEGCPVILDEKPDPLGLAGFWPYRAMHRNVGTSSLIPVPDYQRARDLYDGCDVLYERICLLEDAVKVIGAYDKKNAGALGQALSGSENVMVPVDNWAVLGDGKGFRGVMDFFPLDVVVGALDVLTAKLAEKMSLLRQITGVSDMSRGQGQGGKTATESAITARYQDTRESKQEATFARFCGGLKGLAAEVMARLFEPEAIARMAHVEGLSQADKVHLPAAMALLKQPEAYRIEVAPENVSQTDYAALRQENGEVVQGVAQVWGAVGGMAEVLGPDAGALALKLTQWMFSRMKGGASFEGELDAFVAELEARKAQAAQQPPPPDPKVVAAQAQAQATQQKAQIDMAKAGMDMQVAKVKTGLELRKLQAETQAHAIESETRIREAQMTPKPVGGEA